VAAPLFATAFALSILAGCSSKHAFHFDELDLVPAQEELTEFSLGHYQVPIPVANDREGDQATPRNRFEFAFDLYALVSPEKRSQLAAAWERHEGKIRDRVIRVCRNASVDELQEPELGTLKAHLTDAVQTQLGETEVRQLLITEVVSLEI
jgi:hypothetical protein